MDFLLMAVTVTVALFISTVMEGFSAIGYGIDRDPMAGLDIIPYRLPIGSGFDAY